jgi:hypothetical protein
MTMAVALHFIFAEALHHFVFFLAGEASVEKTEAELWKNFLGETLVLIDGGFQFEFRFFDDGIDDVGLTTGLDRTAKRFPDAREVGLGTHARSDGRAAGREFVEHGDIEVAVESQRECARDGRRGEHEDVGRVAM